MSVQPTKRARQGRSPAYPYISLRKALLRADGLRCAEGKHTVPRSSAYHVWGIGDKSSGARQTVAALKQFGLLEYEGTGVDRKIRLSDRALKILLDKRPESPERDELIRQTALTPLIYAELWREWGAELPSDATIETYLVRDREFNESAAPDLIADYKDTISFAKLHQPDKMPLKDQAGKGAGAGADPGHAAPPDFDTWRRNQQKVSLMEGERVVFTEEGQPQQYVRLIASGDVDEYLLDAISDYVERQRKRLGTRAKPSPQGRGEKGGNN